MKKSLTVMGVMTSLCFLMVLPMIWELHRTFYETDWCDNPASINGFHATWKLTIIICVLWICLFAVSMILLSKSHPGTAFFVISLFSAAGVAFTVFLFLYVRHIHRPVAWVENYGMWNEYKYLSGAIYAVITVTAAFIVGSIVLGVIAQRRGKLKQV